MSADQGLSVKDPAQTDILRSAMVNELREQGAIRSEPVAAALAAVPRHLFAPGEALDAAYAAQGIVVAKRGADGRTLSVMSAAHLQAVMLEQAGIGPGMRVLEVGFGGYNAALIREMTGSGGRVASEADRTAPDMRQCKGRV
jgi:protein-L-isoaspartate(D-aspartate) O-methyltransferase